MHHRPVVSSYVELFIKRRAKLEVWGCVCVHQPMLTLFHITVLSSKTWGKYLFSCLTLHYVHKRDARSVRLSFGAEHVAYIQQVDQGFFSCLPCLLTMLMRTNQNSTPRQTPQRADVVITLCGFSLWRNHFLSHNHTTGCHFVLFACWTILLSPPLLTDYF